MYSPNWYIVFAVLSLGVGQAFAFSPVFKRFFGDLDRSIFSRFAIGCLLGCALYVGGSKVPSKMNCVAQFVTVMCGGVVIDESGIIAKASEQAVIDAFIDYAGEIKDAVSNTLENAKGDFSDVAGLITNTERRVIYISSYLPRSGTGQGAVTNHNISSTLEKTRMQDSTNIIAWVWFSEEPAFAPGMSGEIDVGGGSVRIECATNYYPQTETVNGVPCVKYVFSIPAESRGVQFIPSYEIGFGNAAAPLVVPSGGIVVKTNGVALLPFTGTDVYFGGRVTVRYKGGMAISVKIDGATATNGVYQL